MACLHTGATPAGKSIRIFPARVLHWLVAALLASVVAAPGAVSSGGAEAQRASPEDVEAAYLYNFGKFVRWPDDGSRGPLFICVAATSSFAQTVEHLAYGGSVNDRVLAVRRLSHNDKVQGCSILFIGTAERDLVDGLLRSAAGKPVLTVSDAPDFLAHGGVIQFLLVQSHVRFSVNLKAANRNGLDLSSELLKVAVSVTGQPSGGGAR